MLRTSIVRLVELSTRFAWAVVIVAAILSAFCVNYAFRHFSVVTDVRQLFPTNLAWTERATRFMTAFPQYDIFVVVRAPTPELVQRASARLVSALSADRKHIRAVEYPQGSAFVAQESLLFVPVEQLARNAAALEGASPLIGALAADPSLRGILNALSMGVMGLANKPHGLDALVRPMDAGAAAITDALGGRPAHFSWELLSGGGTSHAANPRRFIEVAPVLDFKALQPGLAATNSIYRTAQTLNLARNDQARVQVTGIVPMNDAQFGTLKENAALNAVVSVGAVLIILWLALRSWRIILAVAISVACGLAFSAALGLYLVGSLNLFSVAFFVLFVGLAIDFGIQFSVRYRAERNESGDLRRALLGAAQKAGWPLALAAAATALGFAAFLPTEYRGLSELGEIAGPGMIIAFLTSVTLLPALLRVLDPPGEPTGMGFSALAPIDTFLQRRRYAVLAGTLGVVALASPLLIFLRFDFNPLHLQDPRAAPVATFLELRKDPAAAANAIDILVPNLAAAQADARRLALLPQVTETRTLANFVPTDQSRKLQLIHQLAAALAPLLITVRPPPSDLENVEALHETAQTLASAASKGGVGGNAAMRLSGLLSRLAVADPATRQRATEAMVIPLEITLDGLKQALAAQPVSAGTIPTSLKRDWLTPDGRARVQVLPKGDPDDTAALRRFVGTVLAHEPRATGPAVILYEAGNTIVRAFVIAGLFALSAIAVLLWFALRRIRDVLVTLVPLILAAVLTMELCVVFNIPLNFTNIIAFPLLLGVGVAFKIYYIMAWRRGRTALVQSTLTRAVIFSAMTTATAFGSLWLSHHPGTSSMGELMSLSLVCTMLAAVLFQPALMGPPRRATERNVAPATPRKAREPELVAVRSLP